MKIAGGLNLAYAQQSVKLSNLNFANQYTGSGFDPNISNGEVGSQSFSFFDAGAGVSFQYSNVKGNIQHDNVVKINFGLAGYHLNQPRQSFILRGAIVCIRVMLQMQMRVWIFRELNFLFYLLLFLCCRVRIWN